MLVLWTKKDNALSLYNKYQQFKHEYLYSLENFTITVTHLWEKTQSFILEFDPNLYPIDEISKKRIEIPSSELIISFKELNEKKGYWRYSSNRNKNT